jgi:hypothetical protein
MKVIIAGGREFNNYGLVKTKCDYFLKNHGDIEIVSGRCSTGIKTFTTSDGINVFGADGLGELYAAENNYKVLPYPADWKMHGKAAGPIRNEQMAQEAHVLIAFWDGISKGTKGMIDYMKSMGKPVRVVYY